MLLKRKEEKMKMKLTELFSTGKPVLSFEVFPPKTTDKMESVKKATEEIAALHPAFMSVTYGAGGGTSAYTVAVAKNIQETHGVSSLAHLTCVSSTREQIDHQLRLLSENGIENIMALRGDIPEGATAPEEWSFRHASELIAYIKTKGDFCIGGACYPEGHPESANQREDIANLKKKVDAGCDFLTTQMFFDNSVMYSFLYQIREMGITVPVLAGVMPVTNKKQIKRSCELSGTYLPTRFKRMVDKFGDDPASMKQAGIAYATEQIIDLIANGVKGIHVYSMNKPEIAQAVMHNLSEILK